MQREIESRKAPKAKASQTLLKTQKQLAVAILTSYSKQQEPLPVQTPRVTPYQIAEYKNDPAVSKASGVMNPSVQNANERPSLTNFLKSQVRNRY